MRISHCKVFHALRRKHRLFFREFLRHPFQIGSIIPSSRFLERRLVETAEVGSAKTIVELGHGTGGTTQEILGAMARDAKLLSIEVNPTFHSLVSCIEDDRLIAHHGNAHRLEGIIDRYGLGAPEVVISGIPFSTMSYTSGSHLIETISSVLAARGRLVAYQVSNRIATLCQPVLGSGQVKVEPLNIPPMRVFRWEKNGT
jgi:phospholipid N-methyltransferase